MTNYHQLRQIVDQMISRRRPRQLAYSLHRFLEQCREFTEEGRCTLDESMSILLSFEKNSNVIRWFVNHGVKW